MTHLVAVLAVLLSVAVPSLAAGRVEAELRLSHDRTRVVGFVSRCPSTVNDMLPRCLDEREIPLPELTVDPAKRVVTREGEVVARWGRFGTWLRLEKGWTLKHDRAAATLSLERAAR